MRIRTRRFATGAAVTMSLIMVSAGIAWATTGGGVPDGSGVIHACYATSPSLKPVLLIDPSKGTTCPTGFSALAFNQIGPQGPQGNQGIQGIQGNQGPQGNQGIQGNQGAQGIPGLQGSPCQSTDPACVGPQGIQGKQGDPGPVGASAAYIARNDGFSFITTPGATLVTLTLPAGNYALFGKAQVGNNDTDPQDATCSLSTGEATTIRVLGRHEGFESLAVDVVQDLLSLDATGTVRLSCVTFNGTATSVKLTAIQVSTLHG